jgi:type II secretory pathway component PulJ
MSVGAACLRFVRRRDGGRRDGGRRDDAGFTVVEVAISMAVAAVVMSTVLGLLAGQSRAERRVASFAENQEELRQAIVALQRDIRSSEPLLALPTSDLYPSRIDLSVYRDINAVAPVPLRWRINTLSGGAKELIREELNSSGNVVAVTYRVRGVLNTTTDPLFRFYRANDTEYTTGDLPQDIAECTVRIRVSLYAAPNQGPAGARLESDAQLRNRLPGGIGCATAVAPAP